MAQEPFGDVPLFREIQRILASGEGPVNLEIARQVGNALATQGTIDPNIDEDTKRFLEGAVHEAESVVAGYSRLPLDEPIRSHPVGRGWWVEATLKGWKWLLDHLAAHFGAELERTQGEGAGPLQPAVGQIAPLLMGIQAGTLVGRLTPGALGRYDFPIPRDDDGKIFLVTPNVDKIGADYALDRSGLITWLALHETTRHVVMNSAPWVSRYLRSLLLEIVDATEIDIGDLEKKLMELQSMGMEALQQGAEAESQLPVVPTERHRKALDRLQAFVAAFDGYGRHVQEAVASETVSDAAKIGEGIGRFQSENKDAEALLGSILGVTIDRQLEVAGATFCAAVVSLKGLSELNRVWQAPDNLPTLEEIKDPFAWMDRVLVE
ncbi:MAG: zinc-dependent metalloprotease [Actinomycetota bacterium]|nr:zinc-dependent metalloprotease [Actinomycetota bacterium]